MQMRVRQFYGWPESQPLSLCPVGAEGRDEMGTLQRPTIDPQLRLITRRTLRRAYVPSPAFVKGYQMPARHWQCGRLRGQASDKPRGRKPRAGVARTVGRAGAMGIWEPRAIGCDVAVVTGRWGPLRDKLVAESGGAMNEGRVPSLRLRGGARGWSLAEQPRRRSTRSGNC